MKMKYNLLFLALLPVCGWSQASLDSVVAAVRSSNKTLIASRLQMESEMKAARTGIFLPDPEVEFNYLWGDPSASGNRTDLGISQSFSFPTVYVQQAGMSRLLQNRYSLKYQQTEREVLLQARKKFVNIVGLNKQLVLLQHRLKLSEEIAGNAKTRLSAGDIDVIRYHHAQMELVNLKMEMSDQEIQRTTLQEELIRLCGGKKIAINDTAYPVIIPLTEGEIVGSVGTPVTRSLEHEILVSEKEKDIAISRWLPEFKAGYYSEVVPGLTYRGIQTGISLPLWQNSNTVKSATLQVKAAEAEWEQARLKELSEVVLLIKKRDMLVSRLQDIREALLPVNDLSLLKKALDAGQISISEFYFETTVFYTAWSGLMKTERELAEVEAELWYYWR